MSIFLPACMFFMSYIPLWISILIIDILNLSTGAGPFSTEYISIACIIVATFASGIIIFAHFCKRCTENARQQIVKSAQEQKALSAEYLLSYILPLSAFDFTYWRDVILFLLFFLTLAFLLLRHNYLCVNVSLELCGYRFYQCTLENPDGEESNRLVLTRKQLNGYKDQPIIVKDLTNDFSLEVIEKIIDISS